MLRQKQPWGPVLYLTNMELNMCVAILDHEQKQTSICNFMTLTIIFFLI